MAKANKNPFTKLRNKYKIFSLIFNNLYRGVQLLVVASAFAIIFIYAGMSVANSNDKYKEYLIEYIVDIVPGIATIEELSVGWDGISPGILMDGIDWHYQEMDVIMRANKGIVSINPFAPLYGGSLIFAKLEGGYLLLSQDFMTRIDSGGKDDVKDDDVSASEGLNILNIDIIFEDYRVSQQEDSTLLITLDKQVIRLRGDQQIIKTRGKLTYGAIPIMNLDASFRRDKSGDSLYAKISDVNLRKEWQEMFANIELSDKIIGWMDNLNGVKGSGELWIARSNEHGISIKTDMQLDHISLQKPKAIDMSDIELEAGLSLGNNERLGEWDLTVNDFSFNIEDEFEKDRKSIFTDIFVSKGADALEILSPKLQLEDASYLAINILSQENIIGNISEYGTRGVMENLQIKIRNSQDDNESAGSAPKFSLDGHLVDVTTNPVEQIPGAISISGDLALRDNTGWFVLDDYDGDLYLPILYPKPFHFGYVRGIFMWEWIEPGELLLVGSSYDIRDEALRASMQLSLYTIPLKHGYIDLEVGGSNLDIRQTRSFIPWLALQENTAQWLNKSLVGGMTNELALSVRGDVKYFGSDQSIFELGISLADGTLVYREDKEPIKAPKFDIFMTQDDLKVLLPDGGNIGDIAVLESGYGLVDIATADFALGGTGKINLATAPDLLYDYIINDDDSEPVNWQARGVAFGDWEFQYNLRSQEFLNADLNLQTMQSEVSLTNSPTYKIANITGSVGVSELGYTGNLTGYYQGEEIVGTFSDNPKGNVLQVSGLLTIPKITYPYVSGKGRFNLEAYTEGKGSLLLSDYLVTSDMRGIALNLPYPLQKRAKASMPLTIAKSDRAKHSVKYVSLGRELFLGWRDEDDDVVGVELRVPGKRVSSPNRLTIAKGGVIELLPANRLNFDIWYEFLSSLGLTGGDFAKSSNKKSGNSDDFYRSIYEGINQYIEKFPYADINVGKFEWKGSKYDYVNFDYNSQESSWVDFSFQQPQEYQASGKFMLDKSAYKVTADIYGVSILEDVDDKASGDKGSKEKSKQQSEEIIKRLVDYVPGIITPPKNFSKFPAVDLTVQSIYYEGDFIGSISANIATTPSRISLNIKDSNIIGLATRGEFIWERTSSAASKLSLVLDLDGDMDSSYIKNIAARDVDLHFDWAWQGDNKDFHKWYDSASSSLSISSNRGTLVSDRANVLINVVGFLNINSYVRAVTGDFSSWSNSNNTVTYRGANINMDLEKGKYVLQEESKIIFPFVKIDASGHYVIADDKLDANVIATSPTTSILPITALILGASALAPLLISIDIAGGDFFNRFSSAVYKVNGTLADPQSSLVRISDISGKKLDPNDLANQVDIKSRLDSLRF